MPNENSSTLGNIITAGELALSLLRRVNAGEMTAEQALSQAETQWNDAVAEAGALRKLGHKGAKNKDK